MTSRRDSAYLYDMYEAAGLVASFVRGVEKEAFLNDIVLRCAVQYQLLALGEASSRLSKAMRQQHDHIPWRRIVGMRNILAHKYDDIDPERVWLVATTEIELLIQNLEPILPATPLLDSLSDAADNSQEPE